MHLDPILQTLVTSLLVLLGVVFAARLFRQPHVIGYLAAGVVLGPHGLGLITEPDTLARLGEFGVMLLLFFVGMETSPHKLLANWRVTFLGTTVQIGGSIFLFALVGWFLDWPAARVVLMGFVISLSSTAVVLNYLQERGTLKTKIGQDVLAILLAQDMALIPMLVIISLLGGGEFSLATLALQLTGALLALALMAWLVLGKHVRLPLGDRLRTDHELQVFAAFGLCLGFALLSGLFQLSAALGAFLAGMLVGVARETNWVHHRLEPFRIVFVALFFVSVGLLVNVPFFLHHGSLIVLLMFAVFFGNTLINAGTLRLLGDPWPSALLAGAHLAQIGEFSFLLAAAGRASGLMTEYAYQLTLAVITLTLFFSPGWIALTQRLLRNRFRAPYTSPS